MYNAVRPYVVGLERSLLEEFNRNLSRLGGNFSASDN